MTRCVGGSATFSSASASDAKIGISHWVAPEHFAGVPAREPGVEHARDLVALGVPHEPIRGLAVSRSEHPFTENQSHAVHRSLLGCSSRLILGCSAVARRLPRCPRSPGRLQRSSPIATAVSRRTLSPLQNRAEWLSHRLRSPALHCGCGGPLRCLDSTSAESLLRCSLSVRCAHKQTIRLDCVPKDVTIYLDKVPLDRAPRFRCSPDRPTARSLLQGRRLRAHDGGARCRRDPGWAGALTRRPLLRTQSREANARTRDRNRRIDHAIGVQK